LIIAVCAALLVAVVIAAGSVISRVVDVKQTLDRGDGVFYPNIYVNGIPLAGKTLDQAAKDVTAQVQSKMSMWKITLRTQEERRGLVPHKILVQVELAFDEIVGRRGEAGFDGREVERKPLAGVAGAVGYACEPQSGGAEELFHDVLPYVGECAEPS
jgi:hypothetical protein